MSASTDSNPAVCAKSNPDVRRTGRLRCDMLSCALGDVIDLSAAGMRVHHRGWLRIKVGDETPLALCFASTQVTLLTRVVWMRRTGYRRHEIGFEFCDMSPVAQQCLLEIARCATRIAGFRPGAA